MNPPNRRRLTPLYADRIALRGMIDAGLSGMGSAWADDPGQPARTILQVGDFLICAGEYARAAGEAIRTYLKQPREWLVDAPPDWLAQLPPWQAHPRVAFSHAKEPDDAHLRRILADLPQGLSLTALDERWLGYCRAEAWAQDFVSSFDDDADYLRRGMGVLLIKDGEPVSGAGCYAVYPGGIEVQVQTREGFEGLGYATMVSAALILRAHERGVRVTWDAHNEASARVADKLGFVREKTYFVAEILKNHP